MFNIKEANYENIKIESDTVILEFNSPTCQSCRILSTTFEKVQDEVKQDLDVLLVNVFEYPDIAQRYNVFTLPTVVFIYKGKVVDQFTGAVSKDELLKHINDYIDKINHRKKNR